MISTHVLDTSIGMPARGIEVCLSFCESNGEWQEIYRAVTNFDGRIAELVPQPKDQRHGTYRLKFDVEGYFQGQGFYPEVLLTFTVRDPLAHHHVPLLLSPFGYSTYRGS